MKPKSTIFNTLGLARKAGYIIDGQERVLSALKQYPKGVVFLANDAGENSRKKVKDKTKYYNILLDESYSTDDLSKAIGKINRKVILLTNAKFIKQ